MPIMSKNKEKWLPDYKIERVGDFMTLSQTTPWNLRLNNIPDTWKITQGEGITIAVLDTGFSGHEDLKENESRGPSFVIGESNIDLNGHQTHVTGTICASNDKKGVVGVAPKAKVVAIKVLDKNGLGGSYAFEKALEYCIKELKPDVINMSLGSSIDFGGKIRSQIKKLYDMNIPVICASGNDGDKTKVNFPARYKETIAIGAYNYGKKVARFSSGGQNLDFVAPGVDIFSTWLENQYSSLSGTSMAAPFVTGVVALMLAKHKKQEAKEGKNDCKTVEQIKDHLIKYSIDINEKGKDFESGYGIIDVASLIRKSNFPNCSYQKEMDTRNWFEKLWDVIKGFFR